MPFVTNGRRAEDRWQRPADDLPLPETGPVLLPADRFLAEAEALATRVDPVGVIWPNNRDVDDLVPWLGQLSLVALVFPLFRDGRAYSQARRLRETHGFRGELRATGDVLRDQFWFMVRAGFDAFEVKKEADADVFTEMLTRYSVPYQPTGDARPTALRRRLAAAFPVAAE